MWQAKWHAFLSNMKNEEGIPLLYIIVNTKDEKPAVVQQIKAAKWTSKHYERDNFKVAQLLETALDNGSAHVYAHKHPGNGRSAFLDLHDTYHSSGSKQENKIQDLHNKLKLIQYQGAKNFGWDKFSNTLQGYYQELSSLSEPVTAKMQVCTLIPMILHQKMKDVVTNIICSNKVAKENLTFALAKIAEKMSLLGITSRTMEGGGQEVHLSNCQIKKMQHQAKALKKKQAGRPQGGAAKSNNAQNNPNDYLSKETIKAIKKVAGKWGSKIIGWAFKGRAAVQADQQLVKGVHFANDAKEGNDDEDGNGGPNKHIGGNGTGFQQPPLTESQQEAEDQCKSRDLTCYQEDNCNSTQRLTHADMLSSPLKSPGTCMRNHLWIKNAPTGATQILASAVSTLLRMGTTCMHKRWHFQQGLPNHH